MVVKPKGRVLRLKVIAALYGLSTRQIAAGCDCKMHRNYISNTWNLDFAISPDRQESIKRFLIAEGIPEALANRAFEEVDEAQETAKLKNGPALEPVEINPDENFYKMGVVFMRRSILEHFGLSKDPFQQRRDDKPFRSRSFTRCENLIRDVMKDKMMAAITGPTGVGKSVLWTHIMQETAGDSSTRVVIIRRFDKQRMGNRDIYTSILRDLLNEETLPSTEAMHRLVEDALADHAKRNINVVVLVNEAHDLADEGLVMLKRLWETFADSTVMGYARAATVIMLGQETLRTRLLHNRPELREVQQRVYLEDYGYLEPNEVGPYLQHRFRNENGAFERIWDDSAIEWISRVKLEITPQLLNVIATNAMSKAYRVNSERVTEEHTSRARDDVMAAF